MPTWLAPTLKWGGIALALVSAVAVWFNGAGAVGNPSGAGAVDVPQGCTQGKRPASSSAMILPVMSS